MDENTEEKFKEYFINQDKSLKNILSKNYIYLLNINFRNLLHENLKNDYICYPKTREDLTSITSYSFKESNNGKYWIEIKLIAFFVILVSIHYKNASNKIVNRKFVFRADFSQANIELLEKIYQFTQEEKSIIDPTIDKILNTYSQAVSLLK